jgi:hypothetical protein
MPTITICIGAHGSTTAVRTRSGDDIRYSPDFNLNFLSIAGRANIQTQVGLLFKRENKEEQAKLISDIQKYDTYSLLRDDVPIRLGGLGTDYVTLSYLVPNIFRDRTINDQHESLKVMEEMEPEMRALAMLADIKYSKSSPPEIFKNEQIKKMWWFDDNPGDNLRGPDRECRSEPSRAAGNIKDNPILSINGLFILHTTNDDHSPFSISNITGLHEFHHVNGVRLITYEAIRRRNLLRKINYTSYWEKFIDAYDFSEVPDEDVLEIGSIDEAVFIVTQIYYAFLHDATDNPTELDSVAEIEEDKYVNEGEEAERPVAEGPPPPPLLDISIKNILKAIIEPQTAKSLELHGLSRHANENVQKIRATFLIDANDADALEKRIEQIKQGQMVTRQTSKTVKEMEDKLAITDAQLEGKRFDLTVAKEESAELKSQLDKLEGKIISDVTQFIRGLISQSNLVVKAAIKNIIMRNKLKNILKFGIYHKRLSLRQLVLFFRSLGYNIINIVDPSCFVLKEPRKFTTDIDIHDIDDSCQGMKFKPKLPPPLDWSEQLGVLAKLLTLPSGRGGTKRKKSKCLRKRRTRKKRCVTRRYRRSRRRN